ncbi:MAG: hypothetical protein LCH32_11470 [Bacteroidetes bacterium]|nr:hypothetical protein [Bacteroidota bacterium]
MKNLLIINYAFPPNEGVGGRRWAKFSKYLKNHNVNIRVINAKKQNNKLSNWVNDVNGINVISLNTSYPHILQISPKTIFQKIYYRIAILYCKLKVKGNYFDYSSFWKKQLLKTTEELILKHNINNIIVSCAPFKMAFFVIDLKRKFPNTQFIVDFRDPWVNNKTSYGLYGMQYSRVEQEKLMEKHVILNYDKIFVVANEMANYFIETYNIKNKIKVIPNGFDSNDIKAFNNSNKLINDKIEIIFAGTFYGKAKYILQNLVYVLKNNVELNSNLVFNFYGDMPEDCLELLNLLPSCCKYGGILSLEKTYEQISKNNFTALFLTDDLTYSISTKFLEYLMLKKPILIFSKPGKTSELIINENLGFAISVDNLENDLLSFIKNAKQFTLNTNISHLLNKYNVEHLAQEIEQELI